MVIILRNKDLSSFDCLVFEAVGHLWRGSAVDGEGGGGGCGEGGYAGGEAVLVGGGVGGEGVEVGAEEMGGYAADLGGGKLPEVGGLA